MLRIAICDDMKKDRERIMLALSHIEEKWKEVFEMISFSCGEDLCASLMNHHYDVIVLDILMNGMDGIEIAKKIRAKGEDSQIIFISSYDERVKELFDFRTIAFLDKPLDPLKLEHALRRAYDFVKKEAENVFMYVKKRRTYFIPIKQILYFSVQGHYITIHTVKEDIEYKGKIGDVWNTVRDKGNFCRANRSFIVNIQYASFSKRELEINTTHEKIPIGGRYQEETIKRFMDYLSKRGGL